MVVNFLSLSMLMIESLAVRDVKVTHWLPRQSCMRPSSKPIDTAWVFQIDMSFSPFNLTRLSH